MKSSVHGERVSDYIRLISNLVKEDTSKADPQGSTEGIKERKRH
jgi:hypothetical protein